MRDAKQAEPLSSRRVERIRQHILSNPVAPGYGGTPFDMLAALTREAGVHLPKQQAGVQLAPVDEAPEQPPGGQAAAGRLWRKQLAPASVRELSGKAVARLEARYALPGAPPPPGVEPALGGGAGGVTVDAAAGTPGVGDAGALRLLEGHDELVDRLGLVALEVDQAAARRKDPSAQVGSAFGPYQEMPGASVPRQCTLACLPISLPSHGWLPRRCCTHRAYSSPLAPSPSPTAAVRRGGGRG